MKPIVIAYGVNDRPSGSVTAEGLVAYDAWFHHFKKLAEEMGCQVIGGRCSPEEQREIDRKWEEHGRQIARFFFPKLREA